MKEIEKKAILEYFRNCKVSDSKKELSIELSQQDIEPSSKIFVIRENKITKNYDFSISDIEKFLHVISGDGEGKEKSPILFKNTSLFKKSDIINFLNNFFDDYLKNFDKNKIKDFSTFLYYIKWGNNTLRAKIIRILNNYISYLESDKNFLSQKDLSELFFSPDKKENGFVKIDFFGNEDFLDFFDKNINNKFFICLEYIKIFKNKKYFLQPLYFLEVEIKENIEKKYFTMSLSDSSPTFNFYVDYKSGDKIKKLFDIEDKDENYDGINLKDDLDAEISYKSKIELYKKSMDEGFNKDYIIYEPSLISVNNLGVIQGLLKEYSDLIEYKDIEDLSDNGLGMLFGEAKLQKNNIEKITNFTLLNKEQEEAVDKSLKNNLSVIVGPPGTGKSQVVINILLNAYLNNKTVIFSSNNNTAVDTVIEKIEKLNLSYFSFLRLGNKNKLETWFAKTNEKLKRNIKANFVNYNDIIKIQQSIQEVNLKIQDIEKKYLQYFQSYEDLELFLNNYSDDFKKYVHENKNIDIDFLEINNFQEKYINILEKINDENLNLKNHIYKIQDFIKYNYFLNDFLEKIEKGNYKKIDFNYYISLLNNKNKDIKIKSKEIEEKKLSFEFLFEKNNYNSYLENISEDLQKIVLGKNFIDSGGYKISDLKNIITEIDEAENFGFFKRFFGLQSKQIKTNRKKFIDLIELQKNSKLKKYFLDFSEKLLENNKLIQKIKEFYSLEGFEEKFLNYEKIQLDFEKFKKDSEIESSKLYEEYRKELLNIENILGIKFYSDNNDIVISKLKYIGELNIFIIQREDIENSLEKLEFEKKEFEEKFFVFFDGLDKEIINILGEKSNILENIEKLKFLEQINEKRKNIDSNFYILNNLQKNITQLVKENTDLQNILKDISLDFLSYDISEKINIKKPKIEQSIDKIYNFNNYYNEWKNGKDNYFIEKYKAIFPSVGIFATTNLSTNNLPLEKGFFDYLIIDEASQNSIGDIIPLLYRVKNVIILGDPNQLENIVSLGKKEIEDIFWKTISIKALTFSNYSEVFKDLYDFSKNVYSVFETILKSKFNKNVIKLKQHFRCHDDIINYSNYLIQDYDLFPKIYGKNKEIEKAGIPIGIHWIGDIKTEKKDIDSKKNDNEAKEIAKYLQKIISILPNVSIGVIAPFRNQVENIRNEIRNIGLAGKENILVDTVHRFQGDEKDIILFSTVFPNCKSSKFLNNENLLNVAVSRARNSFLIFGDKSAIQNYKTQEGEELLYCTLIKYIDSLTKRDEKLEKNFFDTKFEKIFFEKLEEAGILFYYQYGIENGKYKLDFVLKLKGSNGYINVELDGGVHSKRKSYDYTRNQKVEDLGYKVIRYSNNYLLENLDEIINGFKMICELK